MSARSSRQKQLTPRQVNTDLQCGICYLPFNNSNQLPLVVCQNRHLICSGCIRPVRKNKKCPFCRLPMNLQQLPIDYSILDKMSAQPAEPNRRSQANHPQYYDLSPQPSVDQNFLDGFGRDGLVFDIQQDWDVQRRILIEDIARRRFLMYLCTVFFVIPVFILDGYFGFFYFSAPKCTDYTLLFGIVNLRTWLVIISFTEGIYLILLLLSIIKRKVFGNTYQQFALNALEQIYSMGIIFKALVCAIIQTFYFFGLVMSACQGPVYAYELTLTCVHIVELSALTAFLIRQCLRRQ